MAANQVGKTFAAAMELAAHATGQYPPGWQGYRFDRAIRAWACGETGEVVRATIQLLLLGEPGQHGSGCIPKSALIEVVPARGTPELADIIRVQHVGGDVSTISLKAYVFRAPPLIICGLMRSPTPRYSARPLRELILLADLRY